MLHLPLQGRLLNDSRTLVVLLPLVVAAPASQVADRPEVGRDIAAGVLAHRVYRAGDPDPAVAMLHGLGQAETTEGSAFMGITTGGGRNIRVNRELPVPELLGSLLAVVEVGVAGPGAGPVALDVAGGALDETCRRVGS